MPCVASDDEFLTSTSNSALTLDDQHISTHEDSDHQRRRTTPPRPPPTVSTALKTYSSCSTPCRRRLPMWRSLSSLWKKSSSSSSGSNSPGVARTSSAGVPADDAAATSSTQTNCSFVRAFQPLPRYTIRITNHA